METEKIPESPFNMFFFQSLISGVEAACSLHLESEKVLGQVDVVVEG